MFSVPAMACPPLWFIVLDGTCTNPLYWQVLSRELQSSIDSMPPHVHVSLLMTSSSSLPRRSDGNTADGALAPVATTLSIWQLRSPLPHALQFVANLDPRDDGGSDAEAEASLFDALRCGLVPGSSPHLAAALRSLMDCPPVSQQQARQHSANGVDDAEGFVTGPAVEWTVQTILGMLADGGGRPVGRSNPQHSDHQRDPFGSVPYAGGKITFFLANTPSSLCNPDMEGHPSLTNRARVGHGGVGGRIGLEPVGERFKPHTSENGKVRKNRSTDWTPLQLLQRYGQVSNRLMEVVEELGRECAGAALGVDLLCLVDCGDEATPIPDFGLCVYGGLSLKSGAPGPVFVDLRKHQSLLRSEIASRTPWHATLVFGGELRLRLSPGFTVDESPIERDPKSLGPQLAPLHADRGLLGPGASVDESSHLWRMGVCDEFTTATFDLSVQRPQTQAVIDGLGEVSLKQVIQVCFAYTAVLRNDAGKYETVRQMRIQSCPVTLARNSESVYSSLDPEALAVVLFHKLALSSFQDGLLEIPGIAEEWLQSTLVSVYRSAERESAVRTSDPRLANGLSSAGNAFFSHERLLSREGDFSPEHVLLAQGHDRLRSVPLMVYLLMQCDAFRSTAGCSLDLRYAALCQIMSMTPNTLTRCIAPRIQLWSSAKNEIEPILDVVDLRAEAITNAAKEFSSHDLVFFIDTPYLVAAIDGQYWSTEATMNLGSPNGGSASLPLVVSRSLKQAISEAAQSYRTPPMVTFELDFTPANPSRGTGLIADVLVEDAPSPRHHANFKEWKQDIAACVHKYVT